MNIKLARSHAHKYHKYRALQGKLIFILRLALAGLLLTRKCSKMPRNVHQRPQNSSSVLLAMPFISDIYHEAAGYHYFRAGHLQVAAWLKKQFIYSSSFYRNVSGACNRVAQIKKVIVLMAYFVFSDHQKNDYTCDFHCNKTLP